MFIREQQSQYSELQPALRVEQQFIEAHVWSPVANRHTYWTFQPLCRCDERGRIIKGSRVRNPFIVGSN